MKKFEELKFNVGTLKGISDKNIEEHLKLYTGYVKNANAVVEKISELSKDSEKNMYLIGELFRRFSFEYNGMRNHEVYFNSFSGGSKPLPKGSKFGKMLIETYQSVEIFIMEFKKIAMTRGIGWAVLWYDK